MSKINKTIHELHYIDKLATRDQWLNQIHPLVKFALTIFYIAITVSFSKYDVIGLLPMAIYLVVGFNLGDLSFKECLWRLRVILPIVCIVGIANPFLDKVPVVFGGITIRLGFISMITLMIKGSFTVLASYLLIATTTIEDLCYALRLMHVPPVIVTQLLLTYRYISVLLTEVHRITQAYELRAPNQKGVHYKVWGSLTGQLLLRSIDRANAVYESMNMRGYQGEFHYLKGKHLFTLKDGLYFVIWIGIYFLIRQVPIIIVVGNWVGGFVS